MYLIFHLFERTLKKKYIIIRNKEDVIYRTTQRLISMLEKPSPRNVTEVPSCLLFLLLSA